MQLSEFSLQLPVTDPTLIFFLVLVIILFAPVILQRLHIPHIVGLILAGVLVGQHGFNILKQDSSFDLFGKVGLYYIMFLAGLEMNMEDFKSIRVKATVLGLLAFIFPLGIGIWTNMHLLEYSLVTSVLLASMYASHTLISYPIVLRYGINSQRSVGIAVGGTAVTDTLTLLVLAVISGLYKEEASDLFWVWLLVKVIVLSLVIMYLFPRICRWFFHRYNDNIVQYIFVMSLVFLGAGLMELIGMEGILGAFLVGLVLNKLIPHVSPLMSHLEFVGNALFIPYFLIGVGMLINVKVLFGHFDSLKVAFVMIVVALSGKWIACWLTQKIYKMRAVERELMFGLSNAQAAATLAAVLVGYNIILPDGQRLLNEDVLNGTILLILVTCVVSSFITEYAAKRIVMDSAVEVVGEKVQKREKFLISLANPRTLEQLVGFSLLLRDKKDRDNFVALNVINDNNDSLKQELQGKHALERATQIMTEADVEPKTVMRFDMNIATGIFHTAKEHDVTDIIIGLHHRKSIVDSFLGTLSENLLKKTCMQIMIARFHIPVTSLQCIIVAVPPKAEFECGFVKWISHLCRISGHLGCQIHFYAHPQTSGYIRKYIRRKHRDIDAVYTDLVSWEDLLILTGQMNYECLLVIVSARQGAISYDSSFEKLPGQISRYFNNNSVVLLFPEQNGEQQ